MGGAAAIGLREPSSLSSHSSCCCCCAVTDADADCTVPIPSCVLVVNVSLTPPVPCLTFVLGTITSSHHQRNDTAIKNNSIILKIITLRLYFNNFTAIALNL